MSEVAEDVESEVAVESQSKLEVIAVSKPEEWPEAVDVKEKRTINTVRGPMDFAIRTMSYAEESAVLSRTPVPEAPDVKRGQFTVKDTENTEYKQKLAAARVRRYVDVVNLCWMTLPGETLDEKVDWAKENILRGGDLINLYTEIMNLSGYGTGKRAEAEEASVLITNPEDWIKQTKAPSLYSFTRMGKRLDFFMKGVSGARIQQIETATEPGQPPREMPTDPTGGRRGIPQPNPENPRYKKKVEEMSESRNAMMLEAGLPFSIPGTNMKEKLDWLGKRPAGEVTQLIAYLKFDVLSYRDATDFGSGL